MKFAYVFLVLPIFGFSCSHTQGPKPHVDPGKYVKTIKEGQLERSYILRVPKNYDNKTNLPLVLVYHGWTSNAQQADVYTEFGAKAEKEGFILVIPDGTPGIGKLKGWNAGILNLGAADVDDVKLTSDLLDSVEKDLYVDESRVYVAGHSNGAMMAYDLGAKLGNRIAAIGVVSGTIGTPDHQCENPQGPVSAIIFHGKADNTVPYDDTAKSALIKCTSAPDSAKWWAQKDGCAAATRTTQDDGDVIIDDYKGGKNGTEVELVSLVKGNHSWPT
jgi:polyhydroxybutyrate depolymerase